ncbi:hypothetical protein Tco_0506542 [Tanacetum coccineum]
MHGSCPRSFQEFVSSHDWIPQLAHLFVGDTRWRDGSGYQQKDRKPSQNDKTEHGMEKTVQNQGQSPKMSNFSQSQYRRTQQSIRQPGTERILLMQSLPYDGGDSPMYIYKDVKTMGPQSITTAHLCAIDKDCEDFEGPILA